MDDSLAILVAVAKQLPLNEDLKRAAAWLRSLRTVFFCWLKQLSGR
jgi:hypothetical protein